MFPSFVHMGLVFKWIPLVNSLKNVPFKLVTIILNPSNSLPLIYPAVISCSELSHAKSKIPRCVTPPSLIPSMY